MKTIVENILNRLIVARSMVLACLGFFVLFSLGLSFFYQSKINKAQEAQDLFDESWQQMAVVMQVLQNPKNVMLDTEQEVHIEKLYQESTNTLNLLISEYSETVGGAQAALLVAAIHVVSKTKFFKESAQNILSTKDKYFVLIKKYHPNFWSSAVSFVEGIEQEKQGNTALAIECYKEALLQDKKEYIADHTIMAIARNYQMIGQYDEAKEFYLRIRKEYPRSLWLSVAMAQFYLLSNR